MSWKHTDSFDYVGPRTKGTQFAKLVYDQVSGEADVMANEAYRDMPDAMKLDVLGDAIGMLQRERNYIVSKMARSHISYAKMSDDKGQQ